MKPLSIAALLLLTACTNPALTANLAIGPGGVSVRPALSGNVGGANVTVAP